MRVIIKRGTCRARCPATVDRQGVLILMKHVDVLHRAANLYGVRCRIVHGDCRVTDAGMEIPFEIEGRRTAVRLAMIHIRELTGPR